jgi:hypothetical protein
VAITAIPQEIEKKCWLDHLNLPIALFDKGYVDFGHLRDLDERGVFWVTRAKENMVYEVVRKMPASKDPKILRDELNPCITA